MTSTFNQDLCTIGFQFVTTLREDKTTNIPDLEETLCRAVLHITEDSRLASALFTWIEIHGTHVIVEKLEKIKKCFPKDQYPNIKWLSALAVFALKKGMHKWKKLLEKEKSPVYLYPKEISESAIQLKGKINWLADYGFFVPKDSLRFRKEDVLSIPELIKKNLQYRNRFLYGASWRADIITTIQKGIQNPTKIMKKLGCSYEPAYRVSKEYLLATR